MDLHQQPSVLADEAACARLCLAFVRHLDARQYEQVLGVFTADARLDRLGTVFQGRAAIAAFLNARSMQVETRHLCTNILIDVTSSDEASGVCDVLFFQGQTGSDGSVQMAGSPAIVQYQDQFRRTASGWRIHERRIRMLMKAPG
jgi:SnoaL-like domain